MQAEPLGVMLVTNGEHESLRYFGDMTATGSE